MEDKLKEIAAIKIAAFDVAEEIGRLNRIYQQLKDALLQKNQELEALKAGETKPETNKPEHPGRTKSAK